MGRKRRKKTPRRVRPTLPAVFECPACGTRSIKIQINNDNITAHVSCGKCGIIKMVEEIRGDVDDVVDIYSKFVDLYWLSSG